MSRVFVTRSFATCSSECVTQTEIHEIGILRTAIQKKRLQIAILGRQQNIGPRLIDEVHKRAQIARQQVAVIARRARKTLQLAGEGIILPERAIDFEIRARLEFELSPATRGLQTLQESC